MPGFELPAVRQNELAQLFRLPYELRHRIYQYVLTPAHIHIERKVDYELGNEGIKIIESDPKSPGTAAPSSQEASTGSHCDEVDDKKRTRGSNRDSGDDGDREDVGSDDSNDGKVSEEEEEEEEEGWSMWDCSKLFPDANSPEYLHIDDSGHVTRRHARNKLFSIYYCRSQKAGGPSAVPPGYLDHEACAHHHEQVAFEGSTMAGFRATCQWAYAETLASAVSSTPRVLFASFLSRDQAARPELASQTLHFSSLRDLACFTGLVSEEVAESFHSLSVHIPSMDNHFWTYFCNVYLQPWSRIPLADWLGSRADKAAQISFFHNHTIYDLADPTVSGHDGWPGNPTGRREIAEALASDWVVPNIQIRSFATPYRGTWSTKFRMSSLKLRSGSPLDLRLSFPIFLRREEPRFRHCLDTMGSHSNEPQGCLVGPMPHKKDDHYRLDWFDDRRWLAENYGIMPVADRDREETSLSPCFDKMSQMESELVSETTAMMDLIEERSWLDAHEDSDNHEEYASHLAAYDRSFQDTFLKKRRDVPGRRQLLADVHRAMADLDECQGLEDLEIDFFGDAHSPSVVKTFHSAGTTILRNGLVERFTGRDWRPHEGLEDPISVFWDIGPHPEPNFVGWANPDGTTGLNLDDDWRN